MLLKQLFPYHEQSHFHQGYVCIAKHIANANKDVIGDTCVKNDKGCLVFTDTEKLKAWKEHYEKLLNEEFAWDKVMLAGSNLEVVDKFCYLGDMLDAGGGAESSTVTRVRSGWEKFRELLPMLNTKAISLKVKGELYAACVRSVMIYGSETWPIKVEESQRLHYNEMSMIRWMCGVTMRNRYL